MQKVREQWLESRGGSLQLAHVRLQIFTSHEIGDVKINFIIYKLSSRKRKM